MAFLSSRKLMQQKKRNRKSETLTWNLANIMKFTTCLNKFTVRFSFLRNNDMLIIYCELCRASHEIAFIETLHNLGIQTF